MPQTVRTSYLLFRQTASEYLIGIGRQKKTIDQNHHALYQRRQDLPRDKLGARRHEQQRLGRGGDFLFRVEKDLPDGVANWSSTRLANRNALDTRYSQPLGEQTDLRCLTRGFGSLENYELAARHSVQRGDRACDDHLRKAL